MSVNRNMNMSWDKEVAATSLLLCVVVAVLLYEACDSEQKFQSAGFWFTVRPLERSIQVLAWAAVKYHPFLLPVLSLPDASDGLDLGALAVGAQVPPVLVVSAVALTLHDVLLASVAGVLIAHKAEERHEEELVTGIIILCNVVLCIAV